MVLGIALTVAVIAFFVWNTQRAKNLIKSRYFREFGFDPEVDTMGGAALMDLNRWMDANGFKQ